MIIFGFKNTNSEKIIEYLASFRAKKIVINRDPATLLSAIQSNKSDLVVGVGEYSGRDRDKIRIETLCRNKFRNQVINPNMPGEIAITSKLKPDAYFKLGSGMGNGWCNLLSFEVCSHFPDAEYVFFHVPKTFSSKKATGLIAKKIESISHPKS